MERKAFSIFGLLIALALASSLSIAVEDDQVLKLATTTSLYDTGLLDYLEPIFEEKYNVDLRISSQGTGKALLLGEQGDVDVLTIHDRAREDKFISDGYGINRRCIAYNYFLIVGPENDPAGIKGLTPEDAFKKIMEEGENNPEVKFISRGDDSGTHAKEKNVWKSAGFEYENVRYNGDWYIETGTGMGATLVMANEKSAYTLTDTGTFLAFKGDIDLVSIVESGNILLNVYGAMAVNPEEHPYANIDMADNFINFLMSDETQQIIGNFGVEEYGRPLFYPLANGLCKEFGCPTWKECAKPATYGDDISADTIESTEAAA
jgi:tungstate transport system substrate-binding protein